MRRQQRVQYAVMWLAIGGCLLLPALGVGADKTYDVEVRANVMIPMRDGVKLAAHIFLPKAEGKFPVLLSRTPYGKGSTNNGQARFFAAHGYVYISQDCRGKGDSQGKWVPFMNEGRDGYDTHRWILAQPWCNGTIGTAGGSYVGYTQWISAPGAGKYLKAMLPIVPLVDPYHDVAYVGGAFELALLMGWGSGVSGVPTVRTWSGKRWEAAYRTLPLRTWDKTVGHKIQYLRDWVAHWRYDDYWAACSIRDRMHDIVTPMYVVGGWYDIFAKSALEHFNTVRSKSRSPEARRHQYIMMGPWAHGITRDGKVGELNFGEQAIPDLRSLSIQWYDHWLKGKKTGVEKWPPVRIFVMGKNQWRDEQEWPLARTKYTPYYLHSSGRANALAGNGTLSIAKPSGPEPLDQYIYDPHDPVPTLGGCNLTGCPAGPHDQTRAEQRPDVLVFTSAPVTKELEVTGPIKMVLYAASSAPDTDWTAKLVDVYPDGRPINLCDGIIRARFRQSADRPSLLQPYKVYRYEIDLWVTSNVFLPGHRIRVEISSSNFPRFDRNPNTGHAFGADAELATAIQTVYHDAKHPSHILLPIIP